MAPMKEVRVKREEGEMEGGDEPVSPTGQYFNSSVLSVAIMGVFKADAPINDSPELAMSVMERDLLPINPRFSSIMVRDERGVQHWKRVKVNLADHVHMPEFPPGLDSYDDYVYDYIQDLTTGQLPQTRPLWDIHIIKYPTRDSEGTSVIRIHHSLGDGYSLMAALFACLKRADDPSIPLTFPVSRRKGESEGGRGVLGGIGRALSMSLNTVRDFAWSVMKSNVVEDDRSPVRSGVEGVEFRPVDLSTVDFSLDDINKIKTKIGGTVNDVICGIIFYGTRLYIEAATSEATAAAKAKAAAAARVTALVLLNTRIIGNYQPLNELNKPGTKSPWGNHFAFIHVAVPPCGDPNAADPLQYVRRTRQIIEDKKNSYAVVLTAKMLEMIRRIRGPQVGAKYVYSTLWNTSLAVSNLVGPNERMTIAGYPVRSFYFTMLGGPQSLTTTVVSYMGKLKLALAAEKDFIDPKLLTACMQKSFERILRAATGTKL